MSYKKLLVFAGLLFSLLFNTAWALRPAPIPKATVVGLVTLAGKPVANVTVNILSMNCFGTPIISVKTNAQGYYYAVLSNTGNFVVFPSINASNKGSTQYNSYCNPLGVVLNFDPKQAARANIALQKFTAPSKEQLACTNRSGQWGAMNEKTMGCNIVFKDAEKLCTDGNQCQSKVCVVNPARYMSLNMLERWTSGSCATSTFDIFNKHYRGLIIKGKFQSVVKP